jgi:hypothetical protein
MRSTAAPTACTVPNDSPRKRAEQAVPTTGTRNIMIDAEAGPTAWMPR